MFDKSTQVLLSFNNTAQYVKEKPRDMLASSCSEAALTVFIFCQLLLQSR